MPTGSAIGVLEMRGMAGLMAATDAMLKDADVAVCGRHGIGSGWVTVIICGDVAAVESALRAGQEGAAGHGEPVRAQVIPRPVRTLADTMPHAAVGRIEAAARPAVGVLETQGLTPLIAAADVMVKSAAVTLGGWAFIGGALCHGCVEGDVAAVQTAIQAGREAAASVGTVYDILVLPQPDAGLAALFPAARPAPPRRAAALGILETTGYVATVAGADAMVKAADVDVERFELGSGGRSVALVTGPLDAVDAAMSAAGRVVPAVGELNDVHTVSRPDSQTLGCFATAADLEPPVRGQGAMGLVETRTTVGLVKAMDAMLKAADVQYEGSYKVGYFLTASVIRGSVGAVRAALDAGAREAATYGEVVAVHLIAHPYAELENKLVHQ